MKPIHLAISTCPNDTFAFHGLLKRKVDWRDLSFQFEFLDVEQLNLGLFAGRFDVAKASFHAALLLSDHVGVLPSGSALGFGVGPLLLTHSAGSRPDDWNSPERASPIVLCPGEHTTATLLYRLFYPGCGELQQTVFSEIMPALADEKADFGVCIHEGRFTYQDQGLALVEDLGSRWEQTTSTPLPLGGIVARKSLADDVLTRVQQVIRESIRYGWENREETLETMREHAQEMEDEVIFAHVDLYVNKWTDDLGEEGKKALDTLFDQAILAGIATPEQSRLEIL